MISQNRKLLLLLSVFQAPLYANAYITSYAAVPVKQKVAWLKKLTGDICESPTGELSDEMIQATPEIMKGWRSSKVSGTENAIAVEGLVKRIIDENKAGNPKVVPPSTFDYNCLLEGWARSGAGSFAAERGEQILTEMEERYQDGDINVQPDLSSFKAVLMAWRESGSSYSAHRAQRVLSWMLRLYEEGTNERVLPDSDCFDIVLQTWSRSKDKMAPRYAEKLLGEMEKVSQSTQSKRLKPRTVSFNAVLGSWYKSKEKFAYKRVCSILEFMENLYYVEKNERVKPDAATYSIVMGSLAKAADVRGAKKADKILRRLEKEYKAGNLSWEPDTILFNTAIGCWTKSRSEGAYRKARSILDRQLHVYNSGSKKCRPDVYGYTSVLSSCAVEPGNRKEKDKAFNVATSTFTELEQRSEEFGSPNHVTYGTMLKACAHLLPPSSPLRKQWTRRLFEDCAKNGQVGDMVVSRLREAASLPEFKELMQGYTRNSLPRAWTRNVKEKNDYRRKVVKKRQRAEI